MSAEKEFNSLLTTIKLLNQTENKTLVEKCVKLSEEAGELSAEILKYVGKKGRKDLPLSRIKNNIFEESCDVILMALAIIYDLDANKNFVPVMAKKCRKWKSNQRKYKLWEKGIVK